MTKRTQRLWLLATVAILALSATAAAQDKPNILVIWGDDIGWFNVGAYNMGMMGTALPRRAHFSPISTVNRAVQPGESLSSPARAPSGRV